LCVRVSKHPVCITSLLLLLFFSLSDKCMMHCLSVAESGWKALWVFGGCWNCDQSGCAICAEQVTLNLRLGDPATTTITICQLNGAEGCAVCFFAYRLLFQQLSFKKTRKCFSSAADCEVSLHFRVQRPNNNFCALRWFVYNCTAPLCTTPHHSTTPIWSDLPSFTLLCSVECRRFVTCWARRMRNN